MAALTPKQLAFCREYMVDKNAKQAAIRAGYSQKTAYSIGHENLNKPEVNAFLASLTEDQNKRLEISSDRIRAEYARIAFYDPRKMYDGDGRALAIHELDDDTAAAVAGLEVFVEYTGQGAERRPEGETRKWKIASKVAALDSLSRIEGMFQDKTTVKFDLSNLSDEQLKALHEIQTAVLP